MNTDSKLILELNNDIQITLETEDGKFGFQFDKLITADFKEASFDEFIDSGEADTFAELVDAINISAVENGISLTKN